jgi:predicted phosphodiesterase
MSSLISAHTETCSTVHMPVSSEGKLMPAQVLIDAGPVLVLADFHRDAYLRRGVNMFVSNGLTSLIGPRYAAVIVAGDLINDPLRQLAPALRWLLDLFAPAPVFFVMGNHDFYRHHIDGEEQLRAICEAQGAIYAQKLQVVQQDTRFLIATLWTDYALFGNVDSAMQVAAAVMNDHQLISMPSAWALDPNRKKWAAAPRCTVSPQVLQQIHRDHLAWIESRLADPFAGRTVVITHHAPHPSAMGELDHIGPAFGSDLTDLILRYAPDLWMFGHTHRRLSAQIGRTIIRNVSIGYPAEHREPATAEFLKGCIVSPDSWR